MPSNGRLDTSKLVQVVNFVPIERGAGGLATPEVARQWALMTVDFERDIGNPLNGSEVYRDIDRQNQLYTAMLNGSGVLAAEPGSTYANHGLAEAIDVGSGVGTRASKAAQWFDANAHKYGFTNDVPSEHWHWHYTGNPSIIASTQTGSKMSSKDAEIIRNTKNGSQDLVNIATGLWWHIPNQAYLSLVKAKFPGITTTNYPDNEWKWLKQIAHSRA